MRKAIGVVWLCSVLIPAAFASDDYCPASVAAKQEIQNAPAGWLAAQSDLPSPLSGITLYSGPPSEKASLVYDKWTKRNGLAYAVWTFVHNTPERIWLVCNYANTTVTLAKELPKVTSECDVTYDPKVEVGGSPQVRKISCK